MITSTFCPRFRLSSVALLLALSGASSLGLVSCKKDKVSSAPEKPVSTPSLRIYALAGAAGAIEPCGCVKDMLGGVDHAAAFIASERKNAPYSLVLGAGPMFFENPQIEGEKKEQQLFKAEAMAQSLADLGLIAWAPGANDWATGAVEFARLSKQSRAKALGANLIAAGTNIAASHVEERGGMRVGLIGLSVPKGPNGVSPIAMNNAEMALQQEMLRLGDTDINIALIAAPRGEALRWIESLAQSSKQLQLAILGKPFDQGENNDQPFSPELIGNTLVVQAPNHLQAVSVIDLFVRGEGPHQFTDGTGLAAHERQVNLRGRIDELSRRIERWKAPQSGVSPSDLSQKERELVDLKTQLAKSPSLSQPTQGSYFLYDLVFVKEKLGEDAQVSSRLSAYYQRVNEHNRVAFAERKPTPLSEGQAGYVGIDACTNCHLEERVVWNQTQHAHAYATLEGPHKQFNLDCVSCHVTGYEQPGGSTVTHVDLLQSVQCEVCHGPGSLHAQDPTKVGLIKAAPDRSLCASSCHHEPHVGPDWSVDIAWPQILGKGHGKPKVEP